MPTRNPSSQGPLDDYTADIVNRCKSAVRNHDGRPNPAWSHGEGK